LLLPGCLANRDRTCTAQNLGLENERGNLEMNLKMATARFEKSGGGDAHDAEVFTAQMEGQLKRVRQRIAQVQAEIAGFEGDVQTRRDDLRSWQTLLDRRLARLGQ
jgi:hypothetical protein